MNTLRNQLNRLARRLFSPDSVNLSNSEISSILTELYQSLFKARVSNKYKSKQFPTKAGIALSTSGAAQCILDHRRTFLFMQGVKQALEDLRLRFNNDKIYVLYAGTGPLAPLLLPLLTELNLKEFHFSFLEYNEQSLIHLKHLISDLNLRELEACFYLDDATNFKIDLDKRPHLIISETMAAGLQSEPQVSIMANLIPQQPTKGIFIPEKIELSTTTTTFQKLPRITQRGEEIEILNQEYSDIEKMLKKTSILSIDTHDPESLITLGKNKKHSTYWIKTPQVDEEKSDICILTKVTIYKDFILKLAESLITNPVCVTNTQRIKDSDQFKLVFSTTNYPFWRCDTNKKGSLTDCL